MIRTSLFLAGLLLVSAPAALALDEFSAQNFRPPVDPYGFLSVEGGKVLHKKDIFGGLYYNFAKGTKIAPEARGPELHSFDAVASYGVMDIHKGGLQVGAALPFTVRELFPDVTGGEHVSTYGFGDLRTDAKVTFFDRDEDRFGVGGRVYGVWPTGRGGDRFLSNETVTLGCDAIAEGKFDFVRAGVNVGAEWIDSKFDSVDLRVDDRFRFGIGVAVAPLRDIAKFETLELTAELSHWTLLDRPWRREAESPMEFGVGARYNGKFFALVGANGRLNDGAGVPDMRFEAALGYTF